jgi:hypothetical protein
MSLNEMIPSTNLVLCSITTTRRTPGNKRHNFKSAYAKKSAETKVTDFL